jgi:hypothetical protein
MQKEWHTATKPLKKRDFETFKKRDIERASKLNHINLVYST